MDLKGRFDQRLGMTSLIMGSGGTRGRWGAGVLIPFGEYGIIPDHIAACSVGALNTAGFVESLDHGKPAKMWDKFIKGPADIFEKNPLKQGRVLSDIIYDFNRLSQEKNGRKHYKLARIFVKALWNRRKLWSTPSILSSKPLEELMRRLDYKKIIDSPVEFEVICTHHETGRRRVFSNRKIKDPEIMFRAIMASASIDGVFPPVEIEGEYYSDGASSDSLPIVNALDHRCKTIFVVCLHPEGDTLVAQNSKQTIMRLPEAAESFLNMMSILSTNYETNAIRLAQYSPADIHVLRLQRIPSGVETLFITREEQRWLGEDGQQAARELLKTVLSPL